MSYAKKKIYRKPLDPFLEDFQNGRCPPEYYLGAEYADLYFLATNQCRDRDCLNSEKECLEITCVFSKNFVNQDLPNLNNEILKSDEELPF